MTYTSLLKAVLLGSALLVTTPSFSHAAVDVGVSAYSVHELNGWARQGARAYQHYFREVIARDPSEALPLLKLSEGVYPGELLDLQRIVLETDPTMIDDPVFASLFDVEPAAGPLALAGVAAAGGGGVSLGTAAAASAVVAGGAAAAAGGGGGSSDGAASSSGAAGGGSTGSSGGSTPSYANEFAANPALAKIGADKAYARGYTGAGVVVAMLDGPVNANHLELDGALVGENSNVAHTSTDSHGTFVASIIAGRRTGEGVHGVAYNSRLYDIPVFNEEYTPEHLRPTPVDLGVANAGVRGNAHIDTNYVNLHTAAQALTTLKNAPAEQKADVVNASFTYTDNTLTTSVAQVYDAMAELDDAVLVFAAGNGGKANPDHFGLAPYIKPENHGAAGGNVYHIGFGVNAAQADWSGIDNLITVVATDENGGIASFSNRCGVAASWCMAAPGVNVVGATTDGYGLYSGTSFAAPLVSGAAAILREMHPLLTPEEIVEILLTSADKTGVYANSGVYGQGFLDLDAATQPLGETAFVTAAGTVSVGGSTLRPSAAFGGGFERAFSTHSATVVDAYNRDFAMPLASLHSTHVTPFDVERTLEMAQLFSAAHTYRVGERLQFTSYADEAQLGLGDGLALTFDVDSATQVSFARGMGLSQVGAVQAVAANEAQNGLMPLFLQGFRAPYLNFVEEGHATGWQHAFDDTRRLRVMHLQGDDEGQQGARVTLMQWQQRVGRADVTIEGGAFVEAGRMLGTLGTGGLAFKEGATTQFAGVQGHYTVRDNVHVLGSFHMGRTHAQGATNSVIGGVHALTSQSAALGAVFEKVWHRADMLGVRVSLPLRVQRGALRLYGQTEALDIRPDGREKAFDVTYQRTLAGGRQLGVSARHRVQPDHLENVKSDSAVVVNWQGQF